MPRIKKRTDKNITKANIIMLWKIEIIIAKRKNIKFLNS